MASVARCCVSSKNTFATARINASPVVKKKSGMSTNGRARTVTGIEWPRASMITSNGSRDKKKFAKFEKPRERGKMYFGTGSWSMMLALARIEPSAPSAVRLK